MSEEDQKRREQELVEQQARREKTEKTKVVDYYDTPRGISVQVVDGCQYVYAESRNGVAITHKANCNNPFHNE